MVTNCFFVSMYDAKTKRWPIPSSKDLKKLQQEAGLLGDHGSWVITVITGYHQKQSPRNMKKRLGIGVFSSGKLASD